MVVIISSGQQKPFADEPFWQPQWTTFSSMFSFSCVALCCILISKASLLPEWFCVFFAASWIVGSKWPSYYGMIWKIQSFCCYCCCCCCCRVHRNQTGLTSKLAILFKFSLVFSVITRSTRCFHIKPLLFTWNIDMPSIQLQWRNQSSPAKCLMNTKNNKNLHLLGLLVHWFLHVPNFKTPRFQHRFHRWHAHNTPPDLHNTLLFAVCHAQ